jgi:muramoyltetrapeptide carboxypeptidase LdcA involved in peptidoglycan recycling
LLYPKSLEKGNKVGVTATSDGFVTPTDLVRLESGVKHFNDMGYPIVVTDNVRTSCKGRSSDGPTRARELMELITDTNIGTIFTACGGDYLVEMLPYINFDLIKANPKWIQGFSDTTVLVFPITTNLDIATLYGNNFSTFGMGQWHSSLIDNLKILEGQDIRQDSYEQFQDGYIDRITGYEEFKLEKDVEWVNLYPTTWKPESELVITGRALGGNLDSLLTLVGTRFDKTKEFIERYQEDKILWFLESYDLGSEALVRGLWQLREAGWFEHASGFVFGRPAMYKTYSDTTYEEAVVSVLGKLNLPIILEADIGHKPPQFTMINGAIATIHSYGGKGNITFERR